MKRKITYFLHKSISTSATVKDILKHLGSFSGLRFRTFVAQQHFRTKTYLSVVCRSQKATKTSSKVLNARKAKSGCYSKR